MIEQLHTPYRLVCRRLFAGGGAPYILALSPHGAALELRCEAIIQANHYADTDTVKRSVGGTKLHKIGITACTIEHQIYLALTKLKKDLSETSKSVL